MVRRWVIRPLYQSSRKRMTHAMLLLGYMIFAQHARVGSWTTPMRCLCSFANGACHSRNVKACHNASVER